jgi:hypothetical protein
MFKQEYLFNLTNKYMYIINFKLLNKAFHKYKWARFEPGDDPRIGFGHRKVHLL